MRSIAPYTLHPCAALPLSAQCYVGSNPVAHVTSARYCAGSNPVAHAASAQSRTGSTLCPMLHLCNAMLGLPCAFDAPVRSPYCPCVVSTLCPMLHLCSACTRCLPCGPCCVCTMLYKSSPAPMRNLRCVLYCPCVVSMLHLHGAISSSCILLESIFEARQKQSFIFPTELFKV